MTVYFIYSRDYEVDIGPHVFPTAKCRLVMDRLIREGLVEPSAVVESREASHAELLTVHSAEYLDDLSHLRWTERTRASELPISEAIVRAYRLACGGTIEAARLAISNPEKGAVHIGGGFHHAFASRAEGFCYLNDIAVAIRVCQQERRAARAAVVDCDLHQGNGTAHIFEGDGSVFTLSIHQENNYPVKQRSDLDIGLDDFAGDEAYLAALNGALPRVFDEGKPDLLIYVAGADPYEDDQLGALRLTKSGLVERDRTVLGEARRRGVPFVVVFAGGYARKLEDTVDIHFNTCSVALEVARSKA